MVDIIPAFTVAAGSLGRVEEEQTVSLALGVIETASLTGLVGQSQVVLGPDYARVIGLTIDGSPVRFITNPIDKSVLWDVPLPGPQKIVLSLTPRLDFQLLNGTLPPGLSLDQATGTIRGTVSNILEETDFRFTVRIKNSVYARDRTFVLRAIPKNYPASFVRASLEPVTRDLDGSIEVKDLGALARGRVYAYTLDILDLDGVLPPISVRPLAGLPANRPDQPVRWGGLPDGISLDGITLQGAVAQDACPGFYYFEIVIDDPAEVSSAIFRLEITSETVGALDLIPRIVWETPAGDLGSIYETEPSHFGVTARAVATAAQVFYTLAPSSSRLPDGLLLNSSTGEFIGVFPHVPSDTVLSFTVRAAAGLVFADRTFTIRVLNRYNSDNIYRLSLRLRALERKAVLPVYDELLPESLIYRPEDGNFGRKRTSDVYLIKGLDGNGDLEDALRGDGSPAGRVAADYHKPFRLLLGAHRFGLARDSRGQIIYEVLVRELYDPMGRAGGFAAGEIVNEQKIAYPQDRELAVFPTSVNNIRLDLIDDLGFAVSDPLARRTRGQNGPELAPLWMRSPQVADDPSSVVGFYLGIVIAYLKPGSIEAVTRALLANSDRIAGPGRVYHFDKIYTTGRRLEGATTFDADETTFDTPITRIDAVFSTYDDSIKYLD